MMYIIRAIPGACGDIVSAVIDNNGAYLSNKGSIHFINERKLLKNYNLNYNTLPSQLEYLRLTYKSISCQHYIEDIMTDDRYKKITIAINSEELLDWCINRLTVLYPNESFSKEKFITQAEFHNKFTDYSIELFDILNGKLLEQLNKYKIPYMDADLYDKWLSINKVNYPL